MAKPTGFIEYQRELPPERPPMDRIQDWQEFHLEFPEDKLKNQAARCMDCGTPFCHAGILLNGMAAGCPINNLIPEWNDLIYRDLWMEALNRLLTTNNFPEFTGRVCPAPCESSCTLGMIEPPVTIKTIERLIIDTAFEQGWITPEPPTVRSGKKVAVVGSGPAGLACADQLNKAGHMVTVFERADRIGGLLMYGIPNMKLDKQIVQRRIDLMAAEGVEFRPNTEVGVNYPVQNLLTDFDAVVLCGGATKPRDLQVEGRQLSGIHFAMDFLRSNTRHLLEEGAPFISAKDKDVIIIGGGDTGTDCVGTSLRQGCRSVLQFEILPKPPITRQPDNPWPEWAKILRTDYGQEEAAAVQGEDPRQFSILTKRFVGGSDGNVKEIHTVQVEWIAQNGRYSPQEIAGSEKVWKADLVLLAMGFLGPEDSLLSQLGVERDSRSNVKTEAGGYATSIPGVFTAGDMHRGQSLVVWAIHEGRGAAEACDRYLKSKDEG